MAKFFDGEYVCPTDGKFEWHGCKRSNDEKYIVSREYTSINVNKVIDCKDGSFDIIIHCPKCGKSFTVNKKF